MIDVKNIPHYVYQSRVGSHNSGFLWIIYFKRNGKYYYLWSDDFENGRPEVQFQFENGRPETECLDVIEEIMKKDKLKKLLSE